MDRKLIAHQIDPENFKRDLHDERLNALLADGWHVVTSCVLVDPRDPDSNRFTLILEPPPFRPGSDSQRKIGAFVAAVHVILLGLSATALMVLASMQAWGMFNG